MKYSFKKEDKYKEPKEEVVVEEKAPKVKSEPVEDRSAYNCPACKGEGLDGDKVCASCLGTGKV